MGAKRKTTDIFIFLATLSLLAIGIIMVFSSSAVNAYRSSHDPFIFLKRQLVWAVIGIIVMAIMMNLDYRRLRDWTWIAFPIAIALLILVLLIGRDIKGSARWIHIGSFMSIQPSEVAKFSMVLLLAFWLSELREGVRNFWAGVFIPLIVLGVVCGLVMLEPDLGTTIVIFATAMIMLFAAGARLFHLSLVSLFGLGAGVFLALGEPYRRARLTSFLNPLKDLQGSGWQIIQSLYALGSGGLFGVGLGRGRQKFSYLPEPHTDFIFASLGEELGFVGTILVLVLFFFLAWRGLRVAMTCKDTYGALLAAGFTSQIIFQALLNIGVVTASLPVTGITLPLISAGGSSLVVTLAGIGVILNISKSASSG